MTYKNGNLQFTKDPDSEAIDFMRRVWREFTSPNLRLLRGHGHSAFVEEINFAKREMNWLWMIYVASTRKSARIIQNTLWKQVNYIKDDTVDPEMTRSPSSQPALTQEALEPPPPVNTAPHYFPRMK
jgi:hypothetical protein